MLEGAGIALRVADRLFNARHQDLSTCAVDFSKSSFMVGLDMTCASSFEEGIRREALAFGSLAGSGDRPGPLTRIAVDSTGLLVNGRRRW
jgi:hypothetical protein